MRRYLAFSGEIYYPSQGMDDFVGDFDNLEEAVEALTAENKTQEAWGDDGSYALVWDSATREDVWDIWALPENDHA
jgi:hypothetical protein